MLTSRKIKKKLKAISVIEIIASAYQEISKKEMNRIREMTLKNREFIEELSKIYFEAEKAYFFQKKFEKKQKKKKKEEDTFSSKKGKVAIFFSANARFYGTLILSIWQETLKYLNQNKADLIIIGEIGKYLAGKKNLPSKVHYFNLDDEDPKEEEVRKIVSFIKDYSEIKIFHGKFKTILSQEIAQTDISGEVSGKEAGEISAYLFEPSPEAVLDFFKTELISAFFAQAFLEHRLSRHATRMVKMYQTRDRAKERREKLRMQEKKLKWQNFDRKQREINVSSQT